tara:strand:+ start:1156 stop:1338 length:183 start_codon:yes stop_codon:yes gene_type:complete
MSEFELASYIVPYSKRKNFSLKVRQTETQIRLLKSEGEWKKASDLEYVLRNAWWGYKRYK